MKLSEKDIIKQNRFAKLVYEYIDSKDESVTKRIVKVCDNVSSDEKDRLVKMGNVLNNLMKVLHVSIDELHYEKYNYIPLCHEDINIVIGPLMDNLHEEGACNVFFFGFDKNERIVSLIDDMDKISKCKHYYAFKDSILNCSKELNIFLTNYAKYVIEYESSKTSLDFTNNEIALVLGAGCSIDAHICNWYDLCYSLSYELLVEKENYGLNNFGTKNINELTDLSINKMKDYLNKLKLNGTLLICECGAKNSDISKLLYENSLSGFEFAHKIPGTIGGLVAMNGGSFNKTVSDIVCYVVSFSGIYNNSGCQFSYRSSAFFDDTIYSVALKLKPAEREDIDAKLERFSTLRKIKQPRGNSCGSVFLNDGYFAGKVIDQAGLKGYRIGGAFVSKEHANFIINDGGSAQNIYDLICYIKETVKTRSDIELKEEVKYLGKF